MLTGIGVERVVGVGSAHGARKKRVFPYGRARFGSLRDVPVAGASMRPVSRNYIFQGSAKKFQKMPKSIFPYRRARFGSLRDVPVAGPSMRPTMVTFIFQGSAENFQKTPKSIKAYSRARFGSLKDVPVAELRIANRGSPPKEMTAFIPSLQRKLAGSGTFEPNSCGALASTMRQQMERGSAMARTWATTITFLLFSLIYFDFLDFLLISLGFLIFSFGFLLFSYILF